MSRLLLILSLLFSFTTYAQDLSLKGFNDRFKIDRGTDGKVSFIRLKKVTMRFSIRPFLEQIKQDLLNEQNSLVNKEAEIDDMLLGMGMDPYAKAEEGGDEARKYKEALLNIVNIDVNDAFAKLDNKYFWKEFEIKLNEAWNFVDPTIMANLNDGRFFYKRQVTYQVVMWALEQAKKQFSDIPILNIASFVIVRIHDMMMEQRHFHHNMLLHYFEILPETSLGMTKEEVDRSVSSIYEYRIEATNMPESNRAYQNWLNYGMDSFYRVVRSGNTRVRDWNDPMFGRFTDVKKLDFAFAEVTEKEARKIYHLHLTNHQFTSAPALAYDYSQPNRVKRNRALLNLGGVALGFIPMPGWLKDNVDNFLKSFYVQQVRMEGALIGYFESTGNAPMMKKIYAQRSNLYIVE